jgi:hypothetical protein
MTRNHVIPTSVSLAPKSSKHQISLDIIGQNSIFGYELLDCITLLYKYISVNFLDGIRFDFGRGAARANDKSVICRGVTRAGQGGFRSALTELLSCKKCKSDMRRSGDVRPG